jgi:hypothetical protein
MRKIGFGIFIMAVAIGLLSPIWMQRKSEEQLTHANASLRKELAVLTAENERLARSLSEATASLALSKDRLSELMKLRGEVTKLRDNLKQAQTPKAAPIEQDPPAPMEVVEPVASAPVIAIPREAWAFAGYDTPEAALQSVVWAMSQGNFESFLRSLTSEAAAAARQNMEGKSPAEISGMLTQETQGLAALRLDRKRDETDSEVTFVVASQESDTGEVRTRDEAVLKFRKVGAEWKYTGD